MTVGERIRIRREHLGMSQEDLALKIGYKSRSSINKIELDVQQLGQKKIKAVADALGVTTNYILGVDEEEAAMSKAKRIPVLGRVAAGIPLEAITDILDYEEIPTSWPGEYISLQVKGDSMTPVIPDGAVVIVRIQPDAESGEFVVAQVNRQDATVKKLLKRADGITLQPLNPNYEPLFFSEEEKEALPVRIIGKVVEIRIKL